MEIKFTLLIDDKPGKGLLNEHGLSVYVETEKLSILFDTGQSSRFISNSEKLGIELGKTDFAVISHGHYDHGGGLPGFFRKNNEAPVYIHKASALPVYFSKRKTGSAHYVGIPSDIFEDNNSFRFIDSAIEPANGIHIIPATEITDRGPIFNDNSLFVKTPVGELNDSFDHEIFMIIERISDIIIVSGCSHNNILSIIRHSHEIFPDKKLSCVIGGFHLPDINDYTPAYQKAVKTTAVELSRYSDTLFKTGHCTGDRAKLMLKEVLGENIDFFYTGNSFVL